MNAKTKRTRIKAKTAPTPQSLEETQSWIKQLGDIQREHGRQAAAMNDEIAEITDGYTPRLNELNDEAKVLQKGIQAWCETHRGELTSGKSKTVNMLTGEVSWRQRPPSVSLRGKDAILENLHNLGLSRFIRTKEEINKDAMLNEAKVAGAVPGVTIKTGEEDFVIKPFEQETEA